MFGLE